MEYNIISVQFFMIHRENFENFGAHVQSIAAL